MQYDFYILLFLEYFGSLITSCGLHNLHERSHGKKKIIARSSYGAGVIDNRIILVSSTEKKSSRVRMLPRMQRNLEVYCCSSLIRLKPNKLFITPIYQNNCS